MHIVIKTPKGIEVSLGPQTEPRIQEITPGKNPLEFVVKVRAATELPKLLRELEAWGLRCLPDRKTRSIIVYTE